MDAPLVRAAAALALLATACDSPTVPQPLDVVLGEVRLETAAEHAAWPEKPVVEPAAGTIVVRGTAFAGCGTLAAEATLRGDLVEVRVTTVGDRSPCELSRWPWLPFELRAGPLGPGRYAVAARVSGHDGRTRAEVALARP